MVNFSSIAVVNFSIDEHKALGRTTIPLPNNKTNVLFTETAAEAHYLAAWINSTPCADALSRYAVSTGITPKALSRLPIPSFDVDNRAHAQLSELAQACRDSVKNGGQPAHALLAEIDSIVGKIALGPLAADMSGSP